MNSTKKFQSSKTPDYPLVGVGLMGFASVVLMVVALYKSEIIFNGLNRSQYYIYFLISVLGISLSVVLFFASHKRRQEAILVCGALLFGIYAVEIGLGIIPGGDGKLTEKEYLDNLRKIDKNAVPRLLPGFFVESDGVVSQKRIFPLAGISKRLTVHCNESGEMITYPSDRYGFNNPDHVWEKRPSVIAIGDSFTQGDCVAQEDTIPSTLKKLTGENVINLGMGGNGPLIQYATLAEYGSILRPKLVLWLYFEGNDLFELVTEQQSPTLVSYLESSNSQRLIERQAEIDGVLLKWLESQDFSRGKYTIQNFFKLKRLRGLLLSALSQGVQPRNFASIWPLMQKILIQGKKITESWGGQFIFVYLPAYPRYSGDVIDQNQYLDKSSVIESVKRINIPVIDIHENFSNEEDPLKYFPHRRNGHYSKEGYLMVSRSLAEKLELNRVAGR